MEDIKNYNSMSIYALEKEFLKEKKRREELINSFDELIEELLNYTSFEEALEIALATINNKKNQ